MGRGTKPAGMGAAGVVLDAIIVIGAVIVAALVLAEVCVGSATAEAGANPTLERALQAEARASRAEHTLKTLLHHHGELSAPALLPSKTSLSIDSGGQGVPMRARVTK